MKRHACVVLLCTSILSTGCFSATAGTADHPHKTPALSWKQLPETHWYDVISLHTTIVAAGFASNHTPTTAGTLPASIASSPPATDLNIAFANLTAEAKVNAWITGLLGLSYQQRSPSFIRNPAGGGDVFFVDKALITLAEPQRTPGFIKFGRYFLAFGGLDSTSLLESTTQLLSLTRSTQLAAGFADWRGFTGTFYLFRSLNSVAHANTTRASMPGVAVSYDYAFDAGRNGLQFGGGWVRDMTSALYTSSTVAGGSPLAGGTCNARVPGLALNANIRLQQFDASANYVGAISKFSVLDLPFTTNSGTSFRGAEPRAWGVNAGYRSAIKDYAVRWGLGYQGSSEAVALGKAAGSYTNAVAGVYGTSFAIGMPKSRVYANVDIRLAEWLHLGFEIARDQGYGVSNGGTGHASMTGVTELTLKA